MKLIAGIMIVGLAVIAVAALQALAGGHGAHGSYRPIEIILEDLRFTPNRIDVKAGESINVRLVNRGTERHDLNFPALHMPALQGLESILEPGETRVLTLRFDEPGTHMFVCSLPGHAAAGMTGAVFVRP